MTRERRARKRLLGLGRLVVLWIPCGFACSSTKGTAPAADNSATPDASLAGDAGSTDDGRAPAPADAADAPDARAPVTCTWTPADHASACPTASCPIVEDVNVTCADDHFAWPGLRVAPAPSATWLVTASTNERYAFSIKSGSGTLQPGLPVPFADQTIWLTLSPGGQPALATNGDPSYEPFPGIPGTDLGTQYEALGPAGWVEWSVQSGSVSNPVVGLQVGSDGTPNVWLAGALPFGMGPQRATPGEGGPILTDAPIPANGEGDYRFTLARDGQPVSFDIVSGDAMTPPFQLHALLAGVDRPLGAPDIDGSLGPYTVADSPSPSQPDAGALTAVAILEVDGVHVAWVGAQGGGETVVPSTAKFEFTCSWDGSCPVSPCHETGTGVLGRVEQSPLGSVQEPATDPPHDLVALANDAEGDFALAWTTDGMAWLAYLVTRYDAQVQYVPQFGSPAYHGLPSTVACMEVLSSAAASRVLHIARIPLDGSPSADVLSLPVPSTAGIPGYYSMNQNGGQLKTARLFDARAFGTDLAIGIQTNDSSGVGSVRVLRIDTRLISSPR